MARSGSGGCSHDKKNRFRPGIILACIPDKYRMQPCADSDMTFEWRNNLFTIQIADPDTSVFVYRIIAVGSLGKEYDIRISIQ